MKDALQKGAIGAALVAAGVLAGGAVPPARMALGEVRTTAAPQPFQSGSQLSVPLLREIASTLRQIDSRLARLETAAQKLQRVKPERASEN